MGTHRVGSPCPLAEPVLVIMFFPRPLCCRPSSGPNLHSSLSWETTAQEAETLSHRERVAQGAARPWPVLKSDRGDEREGGRLCGKSHCSPRRKLPVSTPEVLEAGGTL